MVLNLMDFSFSISDFAKVVWFGLGITFGLAFGVTDYKIQLTDWFKSRHDAWKWVIKFFLDVTHHWWMGAFMMLYIPSPLSITLPALEPFVVNSDNELFYFGFGLFVDDWRDIPPRVKKMLKKIGIDEE